MTIKKLLLVAALLLAPAAQAGTAYLSSCDTNTVPRAADAACVPGNDAWDGTAPVFVSGTTGPKKTWLGLTAAQRSTKGNSILWARGGVWLHTSSIGPYSAGSTKGDSLTFDAYTPAWCTGPCTTTKPLIKETRVGTYYLFSFNDSSHNRDGGYVIRNLHLYGGDLDSGGQAGVFVYDNVDYLVMENLEIEGFSNGVYAANSPHARSGAFIYENKGIILRNSYLHHNRASSWLGGGSDVLIENNTLDNNGAVAIFDHDLYLSSITRGVVRNNVITNSVLAGTSKCGGSVIVMHGISEDMLIADNTIIQPGGIPQCYGIEVDQGYLDGSGAGGADHEAFYRIRITGNKIVNVGYVGIALRSCLNCIVENNSIAWTDDTGAGVYGIGNTGNAPTGGDLAGTAYTIRNNSIYMNSSTAVAANIAGVYLNAEGTGHRITNNVIVFGPATTAANAKCFNFTTNTLAEVLNTDKNLCYRAGTQAVFSNLHSTLALAQAAGWCVGCIETDPLFAATPAVGNAYSMAVAAGSPTINAGHAVHRSRVAFGNKQANAARDIGAYEYGATVTLPQSPGRVIGP